MSKVSKLLKDRQYLLYSQWDTVRKVVLQEVARIDQSIDQVKPVYQMTQYRVERSRNTTLTSLCRILAITLVFTTLISLWTFVRNSSVSVARFRLTDFDRAILETTNLVIGIIFIGSSTSALRDYIRRRDLPHTFIFKEMHPEHPELHRNELETYEKLAKLQGRYIPVCYGEGVWIDKQLEVHLGIVLQHLDGQTLWDLRKEEHTLELRERIVETAEEVAQAISNAGIVHGDDNPTNFIFTTGEGRVKAIDFVLSEKITGSTAACNQNDIRYILRQTGFTKSESSYPDETQIITI